MVYRFLNGCSAAWPIWISLAGLIMVQPFVVAGPVGYVQQVVAAVGLPFVMLLVGRLIGRRG